MFKGKELPIPTSTCQHGMPAGTALYLGMAPTHTMCPLRTHLWHITRPHTGSCVLHLARTSLHAWHVLCMHIQPRPRCPAHAARLMSPAHITHIPAHTVHLLRIPQPCTGIHCRHYTHIPALATRVSSASLLQRPLGSPKHFVGPHGPSGCGHAPAVLSLHHRQWVLCPRMWVLAMLRTCTAMAEPCCLTSAFPYFCLPWYMPACCLMGGMTPCHIQVRAAHTPVLCTSAGSAWAVFLHAYMALVTCHQVAEALKSL